MSVTLKDVGLLVNLPPLGDNISPSFLVTGTAQKFDKKITKSYSSMQHPYAISVSEPSHAERVAFLQVWLCKYVFCVPNLKPSMSYLPITHEMARGRSLNLCSFFLAAFYRGMTSLQFQLKSGASSTGSGPLWLAQLWLRAYFIQLGVVPSPPRSVACYGLFIHQLSSVNMSARDVFTFFYTLNSIPSFFPFPAHQIPIFFVLLPPWMK